MLVCLLLVVICDSVCVDFLFSVYYYVFDDVLLVVFVVELKMLFDGGCLGVFVSMLE